MPAKKQKTLSKMWQNFLKKLKKALQKLQSGVQSFPGWVRNRPAAFQKWRKESRKKKRYRSFRLQKKIKPEPRNIPTVVQLVSSTMKFFWHQKKIIGTILIIHTLIYVILLRSPLVADMDDVIESVNTGLEAETAQNSINSTLATFGTVLSISGESQPNPTIVAVTTLVMSLVYIWAIRELHAQKTIKARDAYYQGLAPLISSAMLLLVASLQLLPFAVAAFIYGMARTTGLFASGFEDLAIFSATAGIGILSFYWATSTVVAFYVVTLPGMYPRQALRTAKKLVQFQRLKVFKRILSLPILIGVVYALFLLIAIRFAPAHSFLVIEVLQILVLPFIHVYLYKLYRSLI